MALLNIKKLEARTALFAYGIKKSFSGVDIDFLLSVHES